MMCPVFWICCGGRGRTVAHAPGPPEGYPGVGEGGEENGGGLLHRGDSMLDGVIEDSARTLPPINPAGTTPSASSSRRYVFRVFPMGKHGNAELGTLQAEFRVPRGTRLEGCSILPNEFRGTRNSFGRMQRAMRGVAGGRSGEWRRGGGCDELEERAVTSWNGKNPCS